MNYDLEDRAMRAYFRYGNGYEDQPSRYMSGLEEHKGKEYVVLANGILKKLKRWPNAVDPHVLEC